MKLTPTQAALVKELQVATVARELISILVLPTNNGAPRFHDLWHGTSRCYLIDLMRNRMDAIGAELGIPASINDKLTAIEENT